MPQPGKEGNFLGDACCGGPRARCDSELDGSGKCKSASPQRATLVGPATGKHAEQGRYRPSRAWGGGGRGIAALAPPHGRSDRCRIAMSGSTTAPLHCCSRPPPSQRAPWAAAGRAPARAQQGQLCLRMPGWPGSSQAPLGARCRNSTAETRFACSHRAVMTAPALAAADDASFAAGGTIPMSFFSPCGTASVAARARGGVSEQDLTARVPAGRVRRTSPAASRPPHLVVDPVLPPSGICEALRFLQQLGKLHGSQERGPVAEAPVLAHRDAMSPLLFSVLLCQPAGCERHRIFSRRRCPRWRTTMCSTVRATNSTSRNPRPAFPGPAASFRAHLAGDDCARVEQSDNAPHLRAAAGNERRPPPSTAGMLNVYSTLRGQASPKPVSTPPCPSNRVTRWRRNSRQGGAHALPQPPGGLRLSTTLRVAPLARLRRGGAILGCWPNRQPFPAMQ